MSNRLYLGRVRVQRVDEQGEPVGDPQYGVLASDDYEQQFHLGFESLAELNAAAREAGSLLDLVGGFEGADHRQVGDRNYAGSFPRITSQQEDRDEANRAEALRMGLPGMRRAPRHSLLSRGDLPELRRRPDHQATNTVHVGLRASPPRTIRAKGGAVNRVGERAIDVVAHADLELLDRQISRLHEIEEHEALNEAQQEAITGLCNFLSLLYQALVDDRQAAAEQ